ncbi:TPA: hypothetical protein ACH3X3_010780 [Trebouxia sp. C0006]
MENIEEALKTASAEDDLQTILRVLENKSVGFKRQEAAAGPFADMDTAALTGLNIRMLSVIKRAQQQQGHTGDSDLSKRLSLIEETMQHMVKRHKTGYTETPLHLADEGTLWQQEVQGKAACNIAKVDEMLQPRQSFLAALRYLSLLHEGQKQDARGIVAMKRGRKKGEADLERDYYPHMLNIFQAAAVGQPEIQFQLEDPASADSARPDLRCFVHDVESHPGEAKARNVSSNPITDPDGIHNNKEAFGKLHKVIRAKYLSPGRDQVFFCPFIVRIECCWIAKFEYDWDNETETHRLRSCCFCPPIPAKELPPYGVLCKQLDDMLTHFGAQDIVSLTDVLLMAGDASPTPGFLMLVQYVATLCHLHSIAIVQLQFKLHNQQTLDISQAHVLAYGHKSLVVQLGVEDAVYKGAGVGWSFLKLQHIGSSLQADPLTMLPHYWSCAQQVQH